MSWCTECLNSFLLLCFSCLLFFLFRLLLKSLLSAVHSQNQMTTCLFLLWTAQNIVLYFLVLIDIDIKKTLQHSCCVYGFCTNFIPQITCLYDYLFSIFKEQHMNTITNNSWMMQSASETNFSI